MRVDCLLLFALLSTCLVAGRIHASPQGQAPEATPWRVGVAKTDITPETPLWPAGYAARNRPAESTLHPLWVKALALEDAGGTVTLLLTSDILGFPKTFADDICARIMEHHGLKRSQILLSASHTHSAPVIADSLLCMYICEEEDIARIMDYAETLANRMVAVAAEALSRRTPAALFSGNGVARFAVNRRNNREQELTPSSPIVGPSDHAAPVLAVVRPDGTLDAVLFGYACHATVLDGYDWCGDWPGFAQIELETAHPGATALFFAGCGADQNPLPRRSVSLARQYGRTLAAAVDRVLEEPMRPLTPRLTHAYEEIELALETPPALDTLRDRAATASGYEQRCLQWLVNQADTGKPAQETRAYPVQLWRMGEQLLVALAGEVTVSYSLAIKEQFGADAFVMGYANDLLAYIPSEIILEEGGYEGQSSQLIYGFASVWKSGIEAHILGSVKSLVKYTE